MKLRNKPLALMAALLAAAPGASFAGTICSWNVAGHLSSVAAVQKVAEVLSRCDLVALQGIPRAQYLDALEVSLNRQGGPTWLKLGDQSTDKGFIWREDRVQFAGRERSDPGAGTPHSARFAVDGLGAIAVASISGRTIEAAPSPEALKSYLGVLSERYPEDNRRWILVGSLPDGVAPPSDRSARSLSQTFAWLPTDAVGGNPTKGDMWAPVGFRASIRRAGFIPTPWAKAELPRPVFAEVKRFGWTESEPRAASLKRGSAHYVGDMVTRIAVSSLCPEAAALASHSPTYINDDAARAAGFQIASAPGQCSGLTPSVKTTASFSGPRPSPSQ